MKQKIYLGLVLFVLGIIGALSIMTMDIPLPPEAEAALSNFSPMQIKLLLLLNPIIMLIVFVTIGTALHQKVNLHAPLIEQSLGMESMNISPINVVRYGIQGGVLAGCLISIVSYLYLPMLPEEFIELGESLKPTLAARFLYGGLTEEIMMRFGFMTLIVWIVSKIFKGTKPVVYWIGIAIASILFALGHFPVAFQAVENPSIGLLSYILIGNVVGGLVFGWLYWKKGLESAFVAHIFAHIVMVLAESFLG